MAREPKITFRLTEDEYVTLAVALRERDPGSALLDSLHSRYWGSRAFKYHQRRRERERQAYAKAGQAELKRLGPLAERELARIGWPVPRG